MSKRSASDAEEKEAKKPRLEEEDAGVDLEHLHVYLEIGEMEEYNVYITFDPTSTPKHASALVKAANAAVDEKNHNKKVTIMAYLCGDETLAGVEAALTKSPTDTRLKKHLADLKKYVPASILALTLEEKGEWATIPGDAFPLFGKLASFRSYQGYQ